MTTTVDRRETGRLLRHLLTSEEGRARLEAAGHRPAQPILIVAWEDSIADLVRRAESSGADAVHVAAIKPGEGRCALMSMAPADPRASRATQSIDPVATVGMLVELLAAGSGTEFVRVTTWKAAEVELRSGDLCSA